MSTGTRYVEGPQYAQSNGQILPNAYLYFYLTGSSAATNTYADAALTVPNANPVRADGGGAYPSIFLDPTVTYKTVQTDAFGGSISTTDPISSNVAAIVAGLGLGLAAYANVGAAGHVLGYLDANKTDAGINSYSALQTFSGGAAVVPRAAPLATDAGFMGWPQSGRGANYVLTAADLGDNQQFSGNFSLTIPLNLAPGAGQLGQLVRATWGVGSTGTVIAAAGVTMLWPTGNSTTSTRTGTGAASIVLEQQALNLWVIIGGYNIS